MLGSAYAIRPSKASQPREAAMPTQKAPKNPQKIAVLTFSYSTLDRPARMHLNGHVLYLRRAFQHYHSSLGLFPSFASCCRNHRLVPTQLQVAAWRAGIYYKDKLSLRRPPFLRFIIKQHKQRHQRTSTIFLCTFPFLLFPFVSH